MHRHMQSIMSNKRESVKREVKEPFRRRVEEEDRRRRYYKRKRWETVGIKSNNKDSDCHEASIMPLDLIASKILTRLPAKTVGRFRCVCKRWREVTYEPWFISLHLEQSKKNPVLLIAPLNPGKQTDISLYMYDNIGESINRSLKTANLMFKQEFRETLKVLDTPLHANGLMLLGSPSSLVVCNPCTREFIKLPDGHPNAPPSNFFDLNTFSWKVPDSVGRAALSYVSSSNSYKVVQYFYRHLAYHGVNEGVVYNVGLEILTLGGKKKKEGLRWEVAREDAPYPINSLAHPKAVGESVYFKINNSLHESTPKAFLSYNLKDEKYRVVDFPLHYMTGIKGTKISDLEGDACFTCLKDNSVTDIWILSSEDFTLYRRFRLQLLPLCVRFCEPIAVRNGKLLVHLDDGIRRLDYYDWETDCFENVALIANDMVYYEKQNRKHRIFNQDSVFVVTSFVESLVTL